MLMEWWNHPIFTLSGLWIFWRDLFCTFWGGELVWQWMRIHARWTDTLYVVTSVFIALGMVAGYISKSSREFLSLHTLHVFLCLFFILFLALISILYDFGNCPYPSRTHPYFSSGRLMLGALLPFLILFLQGVEWSLGWMGKKVLWGLLTFFVVGISLTEAWISKPVFQSAYNFFNG